MRSHNADMLGKVDVRHIYYLRYRLKFSIFFEHSGQHINHVLFHSF